MAKSTYSSEAILEKLKNGPHKLERCYKRVRGLLGGEWIFDTTEAFHVWEHPWYPYFYIPAISINHRLQLQDLRNVAGAEHSLASEAKLSFGARTASKVLIFDEGPLKDLVRIEPDDLDEWFEEDQPIYGHPKDPYKRIDILPSTRHVKIVIDGLTVAESNSNQFLFETGLRARYYLPKTAVNWKYFGQSSMVTKCPYKGEANYYNFKGPDGTKNDIAWWYRYPTQESIAIAGLVCFYNEKVDVYIDGVLEGLPERRRDSHAKEE